MILTRLLKRKWRTEKPDQQVPPSASARLETQAVQAPDPATRRQACKGITDPVLLRRIAREDVDAGVRELAAARFRNLLSGNEPDSPALDLRIAVLEQAADPQISAHLATAGKEPELRRAALALVSDPGVLVECAVRDPIAAVRAVAVERLDDRAGLERVLRQIGKKDKNCYRLARQKLREIAERSEAPARQRADATDLCERVERLGRIGAWSQDKALLEHLEHQWQTLGEGIPAELTRRFDQGRVRFAEGYRAYREANLARIQADEAQERLRSEKREVLERLRDDAIADTNARGLEQLLAEMPSRWSALEALPATEEARFQARFVAAVDAAKQRLQHLRRLARRVDEIGRLTAEAEGWLSQSKALDRQSVQRWQRKGDELAAMQADDEPARRYEEIRERLGDQVEHQGAHAKDKLKRLPGRLTLLEEELDQGRLRPASALHQSIQADLELILASAPGDHRIDGLKQRFRQLTPRLRELQNWRKWGADQHREEMCAAVEALQSADLPLDEIADRVQALQTEWRGLDHSGSPVNEALWIRFHGAAEQAYERCRPFFEQQAEEREANRQAREDLCARLEAFLDQVDWDRTDWKKTVRAEREMRTAWANLGPTEPKRRRPLERRFRAAIKRLDGQLAAERARNKACRMELIARTQELAQDPDLEEAIRRVKQLQQEWRVTVPGKRKQENQMWQEFRGACDQVFERRQNIRQALQQELLANAQRLEHLCDTLEGLRDAGDAGLLQMELQGLRESWNRDASLELTRQDRARLQRRWEQGVTSVQQCMRELESAARRDQTDRLATRAALCRELEAALQSTPPPRPDPAPWQQRWEALPELADPAVTSAIEGRFLAALGALRDPALLETWHRDLEANTRLRARLCLQMEVMSGIGSPPEAASERLELQVNRLSEHLTLGGDPMDDIPDIERDWYLAGAAREDQMDGLEARFQAACRAGRAEAGQDTASQAATGPRA